MARPVIPVRSLSMRLPEAVRSRRQQLSALQTIANAHREEAGLARQGVAA